jgi:putative transposase
MAQRKRQYGSGERGSDEAASSSVRELGIDGRFAGPSVGVTQVGERIWLVIFTHYDVGYFDNETCRLEPIDNPFGPKLLPIRPE